MDLRSSEKINRLFNFECLFSERLSIRHGYANRRLEAPRWIQFRDTTRCGIEKQSESSPERLEFSSAITDEGCRVIVSASDDKAHLNLLTSKFYIDGKEFPDQAKVTESINRGNLCIFKIKIKGCLSTQIESMTCEWTCTLKTIQNLFQFTFYRNRNGDRHSSGNSYGVANPSL